MAQSVTWLEKIGDFYRPNLNPKNIYIYIFVIQQKFIIVSVEYIYIKKRPLGLGRDKIKMFASQSRRV